LIALPNTGKLDNLLDIIFLQDVPASDPRPFEDGWRSEGASRHHHESGSASNMYRRIVAGAVIADVFHSDGTVTSVKQ
jgi:hypothetical protein